MPERRPRILHIGNIANNAYNNAKVLNEAGVVDCDVLCYDYYHIMGCPEWEDADFLGAMENHFAPDWSAVDLRGFRRPRWFAQAPRVMAIRYLIARRKGQRLRAYLQWRLMRISQRERSRPVVSLIRFGVRGLRYMRRRPRGFRRPRWLARAPRPLAVRYVVTRRRMRRLRADLQRRWIRIRQRRSARLLVSVIRFGVRGLRYTRRRATAVPRHVGSRGLRVFRLLKHAGAPGAVAYRLLAKAGRWLHERLMAAGLGGASPAGFDSPFDRRVRELIECFDERFPDRPDRLTPDDFEFYRPMMPLWRTLFTHYDLIEAYATDPIIPMLADVPYVAYEHGTIREIPFEDSAVGRLTALSYAMADAVVITNPDCRDAAERLGVGNYRFIPHLIDRKYYDPAIRHGGRLPEGVREPYIFCPARHDWEVKGTLHLLKAFHIIAAEYPDLQLVTSSWGGDLERSRQWIREHGLEDRVLFVYPLHIHDLIRVAARAAVLVDQFRYGVFGGIGPTALAAGTPLVTHLDHSKSAWCMTCPPCFGAHDADTCAEALRAALAADRAVVQQTSLDWMRANYWYGAVVDEHLSIYDSILRTGIVQPKPAVPLALAD